MPFPPRMAGEFFIRLIGRAGLAPGIDYRADGLTLERIGLAGKSPTELTPFAETC